MKRALIIQAQMKEYRVPFFNGLRARLQQQGIELRVAYSEPPFSERGKDDNVDLPADYGIKVNRYWLLNERLVWQSIFKEAKQADLLIFEYANKYLANHVLKALARFRGQTTAFWGLGENKQANRLRLSEYYKRKRVSSVDWWFAYTQGTVRELQQAGVPLSKITAVQNSVDTRELASCVHAISDHQRIELRRQLGIGANDPVGIYCGMLDPVKGLRMLLESCELIRDRVPNFHLLIIGGGSEEQAVRDRCATREWSHCMGPKFGAEKAGLLALADIFLLPGRVGLAVLDAFAAGLPVVATRLPIHGPEFEYLEHDVNSLLSHSNAQDYAATVTALISDPRRMFRLKEGALRSAQSYSIAQMAENFCQGITACLADAEKLVPQTA